MNDILQVIWIPALAALMVFVVTVSLVALAESSARAKNDVPADEREPDRMGRR